MPTSSIRARTRDCEPHKCPYKRVFGSTLHCVFLRNKRLPCMPRRRGQRQPVYVSPFVGRLDDRGEDGMDLVRNIKKMYEHSDGHVHVLAASIRNVNHLLCAFALSSELATVPGKVLEDWAAIGFPMPDRDFRYKGVDASGNFLKVIPYEKLDLNLPWESFDITHELTTKGIQKFVADYQNTLRQSA